MCLLVVVFHKRYECLRKINMIAYILISSSFALVRETTLPSELRRHRRPTLPPPRVPWYPCASCVYSCWCRCALIAASTQPGRWTGRALILTLTCGTSEVHQCYVGQCLLVTIFNVTSSAQRYHRLTKKTERYVWSHIQAWTNPMPPRVLSVPHIASAWTGAESPLQLLSVLLVPSCSNKCTTRSVSVNTEMRQ